MTVIERERVTPLQPPERAVFVTDDDRRARRMRRGAFAATALACLWLVGLGLGMLGLGSLPGVSLIKPGRGEQQRSETPQGRQAQQLTRRDGRLTRSERILAKIASGGAVPASASQRAARSAIARPAAPPAAAAPPAQQPVNPAQRTRGWARKGQPAPPGQVQKAQPPPPPPTSHGQRRGQTTTTTTWVPPGQAKKTTPPPPTG